MNSIQMDEIEVPNHKLYTFKVFTCMYYHWKGKKEKWNREKLGSANKHFLLSFFNCCVLLFSSKKKSSFKRCRRPERWRRLNVLADPN